MRFSYIDSQGKEIEVDSVESLALRIELGAIKPDTRMYDAVADRWAPAEEHPVFRSLSRGEEIEEDEVVAIGEEEAEVPAPAREDVEEEAPPAEEEEEEPVVEEIEAGGEPEVAAAESEGLLLEGAGDEELVSEEVTSREDAEEEEVEEAEEQPLPEPSWVDEGEARWETREADEEERLERGDAKGAASGGHREALEADLADPRRRMPEWAAGPAEAAEPVEEDTRAPEVDRRRSETEERGFAPRPAHWDERRRARARRSRFVRVAQVAVVLLLAAGAGYAVFGPSSGQEGEAPTAEAAEPLLPMGQWTAMATAADRAWSDVLDEFRSAIPGYGLPYRPPDAWLEGIYLSNASDYPGVAGYWEGVAETVEALQARESQLYFQHLNRHLERMAAAPGDDVGGSGAVSVGNVPRILEVARLEYERTAAARDSAYLEPSDLAAASLDLHEFLMAREDDILYEPFTDPSVSRDPVLEAVPVDSALRVEMNAKLDQVIDAIVESEIPRPITTAALFNHLFTELGRTETASESPPPPDTLDS